MKRRVLVTGAGGFVGGHLCRFLVRHGLAVRAAVRHGQTTTLATETFETGDLSHFCDWDRLVHGVDAVVHLVGRTHVTDGLGLGEIELYRRHNVDLTHRLAQAAAGAGVRHFVYLSSIKAVGNGGTQAYCEHTACNPEDSYGISKLQAEQSIRATLEATSCRYTILRPPLVYGVGAIGNFLRLLQCVQRGIPLPAVVNARSMIYIENLNDAIHCCLTSTPAHNQIFHVADNETISTADVVRCIARAMGRQPMLLPVPRMVLTSLGQCIGRAEDVRRIAGSLTVSTDKIVRQIGWRAPVPIHDGILSTSQSYFRRPWQQRELSKALMPKAA